MKISNLVQLSLLTALITIVGFLKIPSLFPGAEFQLSAPLAVAICVVFGFKSYMIAGCLSSLIGLTLGTQNILNVFVALIFRCVVGLVLKIGGNHYISIVICAPLASILSRFCLSLWIGNAAIPLIIAALPGCVITAVCSIPLTKVLKKIKETSRGNNHVL